MSDTLKAESFLRLIRRSKRGRHKIYLGYCAGVGKTYQMLLEARRLKENGVDIAAGVIETHGRKETEALLNGLEIIPRKKVSFSGIETEELDAEAVLARKPELVLIDELARSNAPGMPRAKRFQDVEALLDAGIHVISAMNIQHLESLYEVIEKISGVKVSERVPDSVIAGADQIVNVDLSPEDLRQRLESGKVYRPGQAEDALANFFVSSNLEQLRELTLREIAAKLNSKRRDPEGEPPDICPMPDQVAVCLSSKGPNSEALLRYASRLAGRLNRGWYALYVQTASESPALADAATLRRLSNTLTLAQQLGAAVFTCGGDDIVKTILRFAKEYHTGHLVIGSAPPAPLWQRLLGRKNIAERLIAEAQGVTVVVHDTRGAEPLGKIRAPSPPPDERPQEIPPAIPAREIKFDAFLSWDHAITKDEAISRLYACCLERFPALKGEDALERILKREHEGAALVSEDVSISHCRISKLEKPIAALGAAKAGAADQATGLSARIIILLLSPEEEPLTHLRMLSGLSRLAMSAQWRKETLESQFGPP